MMLFFSASSGDSDSVSFRAQVSKWLDGAADNAIDILLAALGCFVLWLLGRWLIFLFTRSLSRDRAGSGARRFLRRARLVPPETDTWIFSSLERREHRIATIRSLLNSVLNSTVVVSFVLLVLSRLGVPVGPLLASAGVVGVALAFGAQTLVKDVLAGLLVLSEDQYGVGDIIKVAETAGTVEAVGLRSTRLRSADGTVWFIPNGEIRIVGNLTRVWSRALLDVAVAASADPTEVETALLAAAATVCADPKHSDAILGEPEVTGLDSFDANSLTMRLQLQVKPKTQWQVSRALRRQVLREFSERDIPLAPVIPPGLKGTRS